MRRTVFLSCLMVLALTFCPALSASDCNENGVADALELQPRFELSGVYPLALQGMFFMAWPRDTGIAAGDLDGDGDVDLVAANSGMWEQPGSSVSIILGRGDGTFAPEAYAQVGTGPTHAVLADVDGDGDLDIATANYRSDDVSVLFNNGHGTFAAGTTFAAAKPFELAAADLDGDGDCDLAVIGDNGLAVYMNGGDGRFTFARELDATMGVRTLLPKDVTAADVDRDGRVDLIAADSFVAVWRNLGDGAFAGAAAYDLLVGNPGICWTHTLVPADLNGDGVVDLVTADYTDGGTPSVSVLLNRGDGTFAAPAAYYVGYSTETQWAAVADLDLDGDGDVVAAVGNTVRVLCNQGDGTLADPIYLNLDADYEDLGIYTSCVIAADVNCDAFPDIGVMGWNADRREILIMANRLPAVDRDHDGVLDACEPETPPPQLSVGGAELPRGRSCHVFVRLTSTEPVQAFSFGIAHDSAVATLAAIDCEDCPAVASLNGGEGPDFFNADIDAGTASCGAGVKAGGVVYLVASQAAPAAEKIAAGSEMPIVRATYRAAPDARAGDASSLDIIGCLGDTTPWASVITIDYASVAPSVTSGALSVVSSPELFRSGDANSDGACDISDAVVILGYLFAGAADRVSCVDTADANDDGRLDIADPVAVLAHLFGNAGPLAEPFAECGVDPTPDGLACAVFGPCRG